MEEEDIFDMLLRPLTKEELIEYKRAKWQKYEEDNREKRRAQRKAIYHKNNRGAEKAREYRKTKNGKEQTRRANIKNKYKITHDDYLIMLKVQNNKCAICDVVKELMCIDHCHKTKKIRGLLCKSCNSKLGWYEKRPDRIGNYIGVRL